MLESCIVGSWIVGSCIVNLAQPFSKFGEWWSDAIRNVTDELQNQSLEYHLILTLFCSRPLCIFHYGSWVFQSFNFLALDSGEIWLSIITNSRSQVSVKKVFLNISQNSQENTCARASFSYSCRPKATRKVYWEFCS